MKINKLYAGIALASTMILTGCGDDNEVGPTVNNELDYTVFDPFTDMSNDEYQDGWGKLAYKLSNNGLIQTISTVVGSSPTAYQNSRSDDDELEYYAGKNAFAAVPENFDSKFYKINFVDSDTFTLKVQSNNSTFNSTYDIATLDLTGVGKQPRNATTGIDTDLDYFPDGFNATFPSGSQCYIFLETPNQTFYTFSEDEDEGSMTIDEWITNQQEWYTVTNVVKEYVGLNNELPAVRYTDEDGDIIAAIRYNGLIYSASYSQEGIQEKENTDPGVSEVYCNQYNDVATKFLETQIKANY
ncbi:hypothetical protein ACTXGK_11715 [Psychrobacter sp. T6-5]|uniref:Uncharacterized protein n=1 Tax=Psychrobacter piscatorii TaxID=554343 RepID=A0A0T6DV03_9GAMM|nr:hypothetical protein [Psychrobacter piscatorii]KRU23675.1 hypothetical protein AS194_00200 [Psychrobacter piscatorii]